MGYSQLGFAHQNVGKFLPSFNPGEFMQCFGQEGQHLKK